MSACCSPFECAADQQFNEKKASGELNRYRTKGPRPSTRLLHESIEQTGRLNGTLLDVGSGIGSLTFGLLERGATHAVAVDASSPAEITRILHEWQTGSREALDRLMAVLPLSAPTDTKSAWTKRTTSARPRRNGDGLPGGACRRRVSATGRAEDRV